MAVLTSLRSLVIAATMVLALAVAAPADSGSHVSGLDRGAPGAVVAGKTVVVARSTLAATRVWLTVRRTGRYNAVMRVHMSVLRHRTWHPIGSLRVGPVFWFVATGRGGLCAFSTGESAPSHRTSPPVVATRPVVVQPLVTPAVGCGKARFFHDRRGELVRGP